MIGALSSAGHFRDLNFNPISSFPHFNSYIFFINTIFIQSATIIAAILNFIQRSTSTLKQVEVDYWQLMMLG